MTAPNYLLRCFGFMGLHMLTNCYSVSLIRLIFWSVWHTAATRATNSLLTCIWLLYAPFWSTLARSGMPAVVRIPCDSSALNCRLRVQFFEQVGSRFQTEMCWRKSAGRRWPGGVVGTSFSCSGNWLRARVLHHCQLTFRLVCRHEQAKLCGREQLKCLCAAWSWDVGHSCRRALLCGTLFLCLSPPVPPPPLFSLALTLISSLINIVLVSDLQQRRRLYISFELSGHPFKIYIYMNKKKK